MIIYHNDFSRSSVCCMLSAQISNIGLFTMKEITENSMTKYVSFVLCYSVDINSGHAYVIIASVLVLHVTCLFCKLCNFFGISVKITFILNLKVLNRLIINTGHVIEGALKVYTSQFCLMDEQA